MRLRLRSLIPSLALAGLLGSGVGIWAGMRFHSQLADALPMGMAERLQLTAPTANMATPTAAASQSADDDVIYQCGMHNPPYERKTLGDGKCPLCGMTLQVIHTHRAPTGQITIDPVMVQNMGVRTAMPISGHIHQTVRAVGTLTEPEQNHREINLRVNGWIQKLYADKEGISVNPGDPLFEIYSPEITAAGDELIREHYKLDLAKALLEKQTADSPPEIRDTIVKAAKSGVELAEYNTFLARRKLQLMGLSDDEVAAIEKLDKAPQTITIKSPIHGHVAEKKIIEGSAVKAGDELMKIADRSTMWMIVQVFEQQLGQVKLNQKVTATVEAFPGKSFSGKVDFVYPHLDPSTRTAQVRVILDNADHTLHENMFAQAQFAVETPEGDPARILIPREAVLDSGQRQIVFINRSPGTFQLRTVTLGNIGTLAGAADSDASRYVEILSGITADDRIVTSGQFLLDSESRLEEARRKFETPDKGAPATEPVAPTAMPTTTSKMMNDQ